MKILTAERMAHVDRATIEAGTPGIVLMRTAGLRVYETLLDIFGDSISRPVVLAGKGNNGGDGFRVAELLAKNGIRVRVFLFAEKSRVTGDALTCLRDAEQSGVSIIEVIDEGEALSAASRAVREADCVVDALFGTGLTGNVRGLAAEIIRDVNAGDAYVVAVDLPSGVNASTGEVSDPTVIADATVTFGCYKVGHIAGPGRRLCGEVFVEDIGFDPDVLDSEEPSGLALVADEASDLMPRRSYDAHKGTAGRVLACAGSTGLTGAAVMSSSAAMRIGAGLVTVACPEGLNDILEVKLTEVMTLPLAEVRSKRCLSLRALGMLRKAAENADVVALGPGLGTYHETVELVRRFLAGYDGRVVLDADGINAFSGRAALLGEAPCEMVLTPHSGELARLMGTDVRSVLDDPVRAALDASLLTGATVLLKGAPTVIARTGETVWFNPTGNESMASAGMGDLLTGAIAGLAAQGMPLIEAAVLGAYVHGRAAELASERRGILGVIAADVLDHLPDALDELY